MDAHKYDLLSNEIRKEKNKCHSEVLNDVRKVQHILPFKVRKILET